PGQGLTSYAWDFGDGTVGSGLTVTHTFSSLGPYKVTLVVRNASGQDALSLPVIPRSAFSQTTATADVNFRMGRMVADPGRDLVYVADQTDARILAVNTDLGRTVAGRTLAAEPGALAVSVSGDRLFVAEPGALQVQVLSLPDLTPVSIL